MTKLHRSSSSGKPPERMPLRVVATEVTPAPSQGMTFYINGPMDRFDPLAHPDGQWDFGVPTPEEIAETERRKREREEHLARIKAQVEGEAIARAVREALAPLPTKADDDLVPVAEAAGEAGVSPRTLREAINRSELPGFGTTHTRMVKRADLRAWVDSRKVIVKLPDNDVFERDIERRMALLAKERR